MDNKFNITRFPVLCAILLLAMMGCKQEYPAEVSSSAYQVSFTLDGVETRATGNENGSKTKAADDREKKVNSLYAVVFERAEGLFFNTFKCNLTETSGQYTFDMQRAGDFNFYLVANPNEDLLAKLKAGPITVEELGALVATQSPDDDDSATGFLMTSGKIEIATNSGEAVSLQNEISLTRLAARFDFKNAVPALNIASITFENRYVESRIATSLKMEGLMKITTEYQAPFTDGNQCLATVYSYENSNRGETAFILEGTYNGKQIKPYRVVLHNMVIKRNTLYTITIKSKHSENSTVEPNKDLYKSTMVEVAYEGQRVIL